MQFLALTALFGAAAVAAPAPQLVPSPIVAPAPQLTPTPECPNPAHCNPVPDPNTYENINISNYTVVTLGHQVTNVTFLLSGNNATNVVCTGGPIANITRGEIFDCGESLYRFGLVPNANETSGYGQHLYHELGTAVGFYGEGAVPTDCYAFEKDGPVTCVQKKNNPVYTVIIDANPDV